MEEPFDEPRGDEAVSEAHPIDPRIREQMLQPLRVS